jgi:hypothetical protein
MLGICAKGQVSRSTANHAATKLNDVSSYMRASSLYLNQSCKACLQRDTKQGGRYTIRYPNLPFIFYRKMVIVCCVAVLLTHGATRRNF